MASEELRAVFTAVETISETLENVGRSVESLSNDFKKLDASMSSSTIVSEGHERAVTSLKNEMDDLEDQIAGANRELAEQIGIQSVNIATAATQSGAMNLAAQAIDNAGDEALTTAAQMGVLDTVMKELSLSGSALSVNIGAFNVSLRNLAPLVPIAASMGTLVTVFGAFATAVGEATIALGAFTGAGAVAFAEEMQSEFEGLTDTAETLEAIMGGIRDLFKEAFEPLINAENAQFFVDLIEGLANLANRFAQALDQMRGPFMDFFSQIAAVTNDEFDNIATAIRDTFVQMTPVLVGFFEWFMESLPGALRFMADVTTSLAGPLGSLGDSLLGLLRQIIDIAVNVVQGLAPAFSLASNFATTLLGITEMLTNGFIQAALAIGGLTLAATKFIGIADTMANIGITFTQRMFDFANAARQAGGAFNLISSTAGNTFQHLRALGMVMTGQMSLADASGKRHKELADQIKNAAEDMQDLEQKLEDVTQQFAKLVATVEGTDVGDQIAEEANDAMDKMDSIDTSSRFKDLSESVEGVEFDPSMGRAFSGDDMIPEETLARRAQLADVNDELGVSVAALSTEMTETDPGAIRKLGQSFAGFSNNLGPFAENANSVTAALSTQAFTIQGVKSAITGMASSMWQAVTSLGAMATGAVTTSGAFLGSLVPASLTLGTALNIAFAGIPAIIAAIVAASALLVGVIGNLDGITSGAKSTFEGFKDVITAIGNALLSAAVPVWNLFIDIVEAGLSPFIALWDSLMMVAEALGLVSDDGGGLAGILGAIIGGFDALMGVIGSLANIIAPIFSLISEVIYNSIIIPVKIAINWVKLIIAVYKRFFEMIMENVPFVEEFVNSLVGGFKQLVSTVKSLPRIFKSVFRTLGDIVDGIVGFIFDLLEPVVDTINKAIEGSNKVLDTNFDTIELDEPSGVSESLSFAQTTSEEVRENMQSDAEEQEKDDISTKPNVNLSFRDAVENNVEVQADPEDKAQLSRITKDALEEANSFARRRQGGQ